MSAHPLGCIGPNAITRIAQAMRGHYGEAATRALFGRAALADALEHPPTTPVDEAQVRALHAALREALSATEAQGIAREAGRLTAEYLLARRIPKLAQTLLRHLPTGLAEHLLLKAVAKNAWTFAGSGVFSYRIGTPTIVEIQDNPVCRGITTDGPGCAYHAATFEHLWRMLIDRGTQVVETACCACGAETCRFEIRRPSTLNGAQQINHD